MTTYPASWRPTTFRRLARVFYARVARDPLLQRLFSKIRTSNVTAALFLAGIFGGPKRYSQQRGERSLRETHSAFVIGEHEIQAWRKHMHAAMDEVGIEAPAPGDAPILLRRLALIADNSRYDVSLPELEQLLGQDAPWPTPRPFGKSAARRGAGLGRRARAFAAFLRRGSERQKFRRRPYAALIRGEPCRSSCPADGKAVAETLILHGAEVNVHSGPIRGRHTAAHRDSCRRPCAALFRRGHRSTRHQGRNAAASRR